MAVSLLSRINIAIQRFEVLIRSVFGRKYPPAAVCFAIQGDCIPPQPTSLKFSIKEFMEDSFLWAVPKHRRSIEKRLKRKFGSPEYVLKILTPKTNLRICNTCGDNHEAGVFCRSVEHEIEEQSLSEFLNKCKLEHRYCKRIISKTTNKPTTLVRIITSSQETSTTLLSEGLFFKYRHYPVYPSNPPPPTPNPCAKCHSFEHPTEGCKTPVKCLKCSGNHHSSKCTSNVPPKCNSCQAEDHQAWSYKCPNRPTGPIQGVPNVQIKPLNKKSHEIPPDKRNTRIHQPITMHDTIINTYVNELNNPQNTNREELLVLLRKRFMYNYAVDTIAVFTATCYKKVIEETRVMQDAIQNHLKLEPVEKEVVVLYEGEKDGKSTTFEGKQIVEIKKSRPIWFSKNLLQQTTQTPSTASDVKPSNLG